MCVLKVNWFGTAALTQGLPTLQQLPGRALGGTAAAKAPINVGQGTLAWQGLAGSCGGCSGMVLNVVTLWMVSNGCHENAVWWNKQNLEQNCRLSESIASHANIIHYQW